MDLLIVRIICFSCHRDNEIYHLSRPQPDRWLRRLVFARMTSPACCRVIDFSDTVPTFEGEQVAGQRHQTGEEGMGAVDVVSRAYSTEKSNFSISVFLGSAGTRIYSRFRHFSQITKRGCRSTSLHACIASGAPPKGGILKTATLIIIRLSGTAVAATA